MPLWQQRRSQDAGGPAKKPVSGRLMHSQWPACWRLLTAHKAGTPHFPFATGPANSVAGPDAAPPPADFPASLRSGCPPIGGQGPCRSPGLHTSVQKPNPIPLYCKYRTWAQRSWGRKVAAGAAGLPRKAHALSQGVTPLVQPGPLGFSPAANLQILG